MEATAPTVFVYSGTIEPDLIAHSGESCEVLRELVPGVERDVEVGPMFRVRFSDGFTADVFGEEIAR